MALTLEESVDVEKYEKVKGSKFRCRKAKLFYSSCIKCYAVNGGCDYDIVMDYRPISERYRCPICYYKNDLKKCGTCSEKMMKDKKDRKKS